MLFTDGGQCVPDRGFEEIAEVGGILRNDAGVHFGHFQPLADLHQARGVENSGSWDEALTLRAVRTEDGLERADHALGVAGLPGIDDGDLGQTLLCSLFLTLFTR